jgi:very-short-patch-repair endonuclease
MDITIDAAIASIAQEHQGIFAAHHLAELRISKDERAWRLAVGRWIQVHEGVYRVAGAPTSWRGDVLAACWAGGTRAVASHRSAAGLYEIPGGREDMVEVTCPRWRRARHEGLTVHETTALSDRDVTVLDGIPVTTIERTIFDLAAVCSRFTVELAIDNALRRELTTLDQLGAMLRRVGKRGRKGTKLLRGLLAERDPAYAPTESERELMLLRVLREHGLPEPERQFSIHDEFGNFVARPDLVYRDLKIAMEYDSYQHHVGKHPHVRDNRRRNAMTGIGWAVLVATAEDVRYGKGAQFAREVKNARRDRQPASLGRV